MNPIQILLDAVAWVLSLLSGIGLNPDRLAVTALFFGVGWLYGKLTRNIGFWKLIFLVYFGAYLLAMLANADPLIVWGFIFGILANHSYLYWGVFSWARDLNDIIFAFRYRRAFEDIRRREQELEELERQLRSQARAQANTQQPSATQQQWKAQSKARQGKSSGSTGSSNPGSAGGNPNYRQKRIGSQGSGSNNTTSGSNSAGGLKAQYQRILSLDPFAEYSKEELRQAFRKRAKETHPDKGGTAQEFQEVNSAYRWLYAQ